MKKTIIIISILLLLGGGGAGAYFFVLNKPEPEVAGAEAETPVEETKDPIFVRLDPPLVVNFTHRGNLRYLQTSLELMHRDEGVIEDVTLNMPVIRNNLIMVLSDQTFEDLSSKSAKEDLRIKISDTVAQIVHAEPPVETYITSFVMQ